MPKVKNGKILSAEESAALMHRTYKSGAKYGKIGKLLSKPMSQTMVGRLIRGESAAPPSVFAEIEKIISKFEKIKQYENKLCV